MRTRLRIYSALLVLSIAGRAYALPGPRAATVTRPSSDELERAFARHDAVELERLGSRLGAVRLIALAERGTPVVRQAALGALELTSGSLGFLPRLVALAAAPDTDPAIALATMDTVRRIAERVPRGEVDLDELPGDLPRAAIDALATFASREERPVALRVHAVSALAALASIEPNAAKKLAALVTARDPIMRRAVADALPSSSVPTLAKLIVEDGTADVALAAAGALCREIPPPGAEKKGDRSLARAAELAAGARARLRELVKDAALPELDRLDVVPCLRRGAQRSEEQSADQALLVELGRGPEGAMKKRARSYGGR